MIEKIVIKGGNSEIVIEKNNTVEFKFYDEQGDCDAGSFDDLATIIANRHAVHKALSDSEKKVQELEAQLAGKSFVIHVMFGVAILAAVVGLGILMWGAA